MAWFRPTQTLNDPLPPQVLTLRRGDRLPAFAGSIEDGRGGVIDLTDCRVFMTLRPMSANVEQPAQLVDLELTIETPEQGFVSYDWQYSETSAPAAEYDVVLRIEHTDGTIMSAPTADMSVVVNIRPSPTSSYFEVDSNGALVPDGEGGYVLS